EDAVLLLLLLLPALLFLLLARPALLLRHATPSAPVRHQSSGVSSCGPPTPTDTFSAQSPWPGERPCRSILADAHFRLGATSSASISILERRSPSGVSHELVRRRPTTTTRLPWASVSATFSAMVRHAVTSKNDVSASFHWPVASSFTRRLTATPNLTSAAPFA